MKASTIIGILIGIGGIAMGAIMEGVALGGTIAPAALLIVLGGTLGATISSYGLEEAKRIPAGYKIAFNAPDHSVGGKVAELVGFAERARKDGLLALEDDVAQIEDAYMRKGLQLVVDGTDPEMLREILEAEVDAMSGRHRKLMTVFKDAGAFGPTMGVLGTVLSLLHVLGNLSNPDALGPMIAAAFLATLYGVGSANIIFLPVANRLKQISEAEVEARLVVLEGILAIQAGDNPRVVQEKLLSFVPPGERAAVEEAATGKKPEGAPAAEAVAA